MSAYLYPELPSKKAYKEAIKQGETITARENTPWGQKEVTNGPVTFEGPHYPKPHKYYGKAVVKEGRVISIS
jgi:hypothetical protein